MPRKRRRNELDELIEADVGQVRDLPGLPISSLAPFEAMGGASSTALAPLPEGVEIAPAPFGLKHLQALASMVRQGTDGGRRIVEFWVRVMLDENAPLRFRHAAAIELANRGFGKPPQEVMSEINVTHQVIHTRLAGLSDAELLELDKPADVSRYLTIEVEATSPEDEPKLPEWTPD